MISNIFGLICGAVGSTVMIINYEEFIRIFGKILGIIFLIVIVGFFFTLIIFPIKQMLILLKDYKLLKNKELISVLGKVIVVRNNIRKWKDENGILILGLKEFLTCPDAIKS